MNNMTRRSFAASASLLAAATITRAEDPKDNKPPVPERDYPAPQFQPKFAKPQLSKLLVQDFVIFAHSDLEMTKRLQEKQPALVNAFMDWGAGDWESGLGGASHMGRRDIAEFLLRKWQKLRQAGQSSRLIFAKGLTAGTSPRHGIFVLCKIVV